jgi:hypothetical protein
MITLLFKPSRLFFVYMLSPRLCLGLFIFKAFSLAASKMLVFGAFAPIPKGSNMNSPACNAGRPMKPLPKPEGLEFSHLHAFPHDPFALPDSRDLIPAA